VYEKNGGFGQLLEAFPRCFGNDRTSVIAHGVASNAEEKVIRHGGGGVREDVLDSPAFLIACRIFKDTGSSKSN
jgi:hypothetical protein